MVAASVLLHFALRREFTSLDGVPLKTVWLTTPATPSRARQDSRSHEGNEPDRSSWSLEVGHVVARLVPLVLGR
jgi:hypothetical protein